jgi:hypothetical protein
MPQMKKYLLAAVAALALGGPAIADPTPQEMYEMRTMHPIAPDATRLPSHSTIGHLRSGFDVLLGHDAIRFREIIDAVANPDTEAEAVNFDAKSELIYAWINDGYVSMDDWKNLNPDELLNTVKENTAAGNEVRRSNWRSLDGYRSRRSIRRITPSRGRSRSSRATASR